MIQNIGFIGLGIIGGAIAKSIKKTHDDYKIYAYNRYYPQENKDLSMAHDESVVDVICNSLSDFSVCDIIFLCAPVLANINYLESLKGIIKEDCIITDVGSVKGNIHEAVKNIGLEQNFIGGHPMTGSERTGYANSSAQIMENAYYLLTPCETTHEHMISNLTTLIRDIGSIPYTLDYHEHDDITAAISHLPHIIAASLVNMVRENDGESEHMKTFAAGGFKDITRIASSSPEMWQNICLSNTDSIRKFLDIYKASLDRVENAMLNHDEIFLYNIFDTARDYRNSIPSKGKGTLPKVYDLYVDIPDVPGIIAIIATILSSNAVSIKNIGIIHNREFENGVLRIEFYNEDAVNAARIALKKYPYPIYDR
ncbi:MAG: prephenate dehydrogenase [Lachnospiraceae bacterium]|nr:prephenate dehydrogenase [Lachnospiraceae bacterium]